MRLINTLRFSSSQITKIFKNESWRKCIKYEILNFHHSSYNDILIVDVMRMIILSRRKYDIVCLKYEICRKVVWWGIFFFQIAQGSIGDLDEDRVYDKSKWSESWNLYEVSSSIYLHDTQFDDRELSSWFTEIIWRRVSFLNDQLTWIDEYIKR